MADELVQFLRDRLDEDETVARQAARGPWRRDYHAAFMHGIKDADGRALIGGGLMESPNVNHAVRHDPARVLAEVEAKRQLVDRYERAMENRRAHPDDLASAGALLALHGAVKLLALPYADHPDYREEWRP